jgi:hypothetical protein
VPCKNPFKIKFEKHIGVFFLKFDKLFTHAMKQSLETASELHCPGVYLSIELRKPSMVTEK